MSELEGNQQMSDSVEFTDKFSFLKQTCCEQEFETKMLSKVSVTCYERRHAIRAYHDNEHNFLKISRYRAPMQTLEGGSSALEIDLDVH
jgi:hypothetical protein